MLGKIKNRHLVLIFFIILILIVGIIDQATGAEFSMTILYLIPVALFAMYNYARIPGIIFCAFTATTLWLLAELRAGNFSVFFFPIWNAFMKLVIFGAVGLLLYYLKEKQRKLSDVNKYLLASNEEKNTFVGIAAHDLRNPISGIYSLSDLLLTNHKENLDPELTEGLGYIKSLSNDTLSILQDLLNVSRLESGKLELKIKSEDYIQFIKQEIGLNQLIARHKNITIRFKTMTESIIADFDKNYMREVIGNLLSNAIKYSNQNSFIDVKVLITDDGKILTEVTDTGRGIAEEEQKKLFRYFQTTSTQPTNGEQSTGLGLAIAKQVITLHKGNIWVQSTLNQGSTFYYTFPQKNMEL